MKYKILIVLAKFYEDLSKNLIFGAKEKLKGKANVKIIEVSGSFEIPVVISKNIKKYDAVFLNGNGEESLAIQNIIKHTSPNIKIFEAQYMPTNIDKLEYDKNYLAFSGIGNPDSFIKTLKKNKF